MKYIQAKMQAKKTGKLGDKQTVRKKASEQISSDNEGFRQNDKPEDRSSAHRHEVIASGQEIRPQ